MNPQIDAMIGQSVQAFQSGNLRGAESILLRVLQVYPTAYPALQIMGLVKASQGNHIEAIKHFKKALKINATDPALIYNLAHALVSSNQISEAITYFEKLTKTHPGNADAWFNLAKCLSHTGRKKEAMNAIDHALQFEPNNIQMMMVKGGALRDLNQFDDALKMFTEIVNLDPGHFPAWLDLGHTYGQLGQAEAALLANDKAIEISPTDADAWCNRGVYLIALKRYEEALVANEKAIEFLPTHATAWLNKGSVLRQLRRYQEALIALDRAVEVKPDNSEAWLNMGATLHDLNKYEMGLWASEKAIELNPMLPVAWFNKALSLDHLKRYSEAISAFNKAIECGASHPNLLGTFAHTKMLIADWTDIGSLLSKLLSDLKESKQDISPFSLLSLEDDPKLQMEVSKTFVKDMAAVQPIPYIKPQKTRKKIRIGYFSSDLREHPVGVLLAELIELHDRDHFEVYGFSLKGAKESDKIRGRLMKAFDHFVSLEDVSESGILVQARERDLDTVREYDLDIAIDLNGHTEGNYTAIFFSRIAPVQVNFLGYAGTMGASCFDYIVADRVVIPSEWQECYTEKVAYLPNSYLMYDTTSKTPAIPPSRQDLGLPEQGIVFCGFHNSYKISKEILQSWSNILRAVDGSVLWLTENNADFKKNILNEFLLEGIEKERIIFASRVDSMEDHLARFKQADLFLDAWPYNAHSTAMDALNVGVPLLTKIGNAFASRVGASLLTTAGLPELITGSREEYEALAIDLAKNPAKLSEMRSRVQSEGARSKLFNTQQFARDLENLYTQMHQKSKQDLPVEHLYVQS